MPHVKLTVFFLLLAVWRYFRFDEASHAVTEYRVIFVEQFAHLRAHPALLVAYDAGQSRRVFLGESNTACKHNIYAAPIKPAQSKREIV